MVKSSIAVPLMAVTLGAACTLAWTAARGTDAEHEQGIHDLVLKAAGRQAVPPGSVRIPIDVGGTTYEVIVVAPGTGRWIHAGPSAD